MGEELWEDMLKAEIEHSPTTALHYTVREERRERRRGGRGGRVRELPSPIPHPCSCIILLVLSHVLCTHDSEAPNIHSSQSLRSLQSERWNRDQSPSSKVWLPGYFNYVESLEAWFSLALLKACLLCISGETLTEPVNLGISLPPTGPQ